VSGSGCSFLFVDGPPAQHQKMAYFDCTSSNALPVIDVALGGIYGIGAASELATSVDSGTTSDRTSAFVALGAATLFVASGITGFSKTSSCREAKDQLVHRASQRPAGHAAPGFAPASPPPGYGAPPVPYDPWLGPPAAAAPPDTPPPGANAAPPPAAPQPAAPPAADGGAPPPP
jgi:hypothetical protein